MIEKLKRLLRVPLVHFLLASAGIYAIYVGVAGNDNSGDDRTITVSAAEIDALTEQWARIWQRPPTEEEREAIIRGSVRKQALYREALAMGLEQGDTVVERRLAQRLEMLAKSLMAPEEPSEEQLRAWFKENEDEFRQPDRYSMLQVYFDPDRRDATTLEDARAALVELQSMEGIPSDISNYGDRLMSQNYYADRTELDLRKSFGSGFVQQVIELEPGRWHGPILSGYGAHIVYVIEVKREPAPEYEAFEEQVKAGWTADTIEELGEQFIDNLVAKYEITIEQPEGLVTIPGSATSPRQ